MPWYSSVHHKKFNLTGVLLVGLFWGLVLVLTGCGGCKGGEDNNSTGSCMAGELDCSCDEGRVCGLSSSGVQLACNAESVCVLPACEPGDVGCACDEGACGAGLECNSTSGVERCEVAGCAIGDEGCGCALDRGCSEGLVCTEGRCQASSCAPGSPGCACTQGYTCDAGLRCELDDEKCRDAASCTPGNLGCECSSDDSCVGGLICVGDQCQAADCPAGRSGCACLDGACGADAEGEPLQCVGNVCQEMACLPGQPGCACRFGTQCDGDSDTCVDGFCQPGDCIPGTLGCGCLAGGCDPGLSCQNNAICVNNTGLKNGPCKADGTCERNNRCDRSISPEKCVYCDLGTKGCQCQDDGSCGAGLNCVENHCVGNETVFAREVPGDIICYTPCANDLVSADGTTRHCEEGLIEGCLTGQICDKGSCVDEADGEADICFEDSDCANFQLCIKGYCYAQCSFDSDCDDGLTCHDKVCRESCSLLEDTCPRGTGCETVDGQNGYCVTSATDRPAMMSPPPVQGSVGVDTNVIEMTNTSISRVITLTNNTNQYVNFTLRKVEHNALLSDQSRDKVQDYATDSMCTGSSCPLWWIEMGEFGSISDERSIDVRVPPQCGDDCPRITVRVKQAGIDAIRWRGVIEVESDVASDRIDLSYVATPEGRWSGKMYYFANFETEGIDTVGGISGWLDQANRDSVSSVKNGLIQRWGAFRKGDLTGGWSEMKAVLNATQTEQWKNGSVQEDCIAPNGACYLYDTALPKVYVTSLDAAPIPTGVSEFPMAMNLRVTSSAEPAKFSGRIESSAALHYAGNPAVSLEFDGNPANTASCDPEVQTNCVNFLTGLSSVLSVGGRYQPAKDASTCAPGFEMQTFPWLVPGFLADAQLDNNTGLYDARRCVDSRLPFASNPSPEEAALNRTLAFSNPVPDGEVLDREVEFLDGAMIDQNEIFVMFRERYPSFLGQNNSAVAYGYMVLRRQPVQLDEEDANGNGEPDAYEGSMPPQGLSGANIDHSAVCSPDIIKKILGPTTSLNAGNAPEVISALIDGGRPPSSAQLVPGGSEQVHYVCEDTGLINGGSQNTASWGGGNVGPNDDSCALAMNGVCEDSVVVCATGTDSTDCGSAGDDSCASSKNGLCEEGGYACAAGTDQTDCGFGSNDSCGTASNGVCEDNVPTCAAGTDLTDCGPRYSDLRESCPKGSNVTYFTVGAGAPNMASLACQQNGTCAQQLANWQQNGAFFLKQINPSWKCADNKIFCDENLRDRRHGKIFYKANTQDLHFLSMHAEIEEAFRYKIRFTSRSGSTIGFVPQVCEPINTPYCYSPEQIQGLRERTDCLLDIYEQFYSTSDNGDPASAVQLYDYLRESFSEVIKPNARGGLGEVEDGFEKLNAELLIMLGDDAFTSAFESRFDLAGGLAANFEGERFEDGGINLSGVAGYEMFKLYQATQYYNMVLDHFYEMGDVMGASLAAQQVNSARAIITPETVVSYFGRVIRASTQRARALSEIARRYQNFNRPDLARRVAQRAYTRTYLESVMLATLINEIYTITGGSNRPQVLAALEDAQLRYRVALLDLSGVYNSISQDINYFGYDPDFIPFPALDQAIAITTQNNAFFKVHQTALSKLEIARRREEAALSQTRTYETDEASFQAELTRISRTYEAQLGGVCGTFQGRDGRVYPAIERYAYLDDRLANMGDPCGFAGNGQIHSGLAQLQLQELELRKVATQLESLLQRIDNERLRASAQCNRIFALADYQFTANQTLKNLEEESLVIQEQIDRSLRIAQLGAATAGLLKCGGPDCASVGPALGVLVGSAAISEAVIVGSQIYAASRRKERSELELESARWATENQCDSLLIDSNARIADLVLGMKDLELAMLAAEYKMALTMGDIQKLRQESTRLQLEWEDNLSLSINVQAAKNDPNVRIYRNDSVINAEVSFSDALREAYRLTRVYEYYTSTSYAQRDKLFLTRMVSSGDINLENYVYELANAFTEFEESYGTPDQRLQIISLRDDILNIPRLGENNEALSTDERTRRLRDALTDPGLLNAQGYLTIPFRTDLEALSPLTRNHKVLYMEVGIEGDDNGDFLGRLYVRQLGTGIISSVEDEIQYYRFPDRTAVLNPFFNNAYQFKENPDLYRNFRFRDLPMVNTNWELVINQRNEEVNKDINVSLLTDVKLYVYYTDFTVY